MRTYLFIRGTVLAASLTLIPWVPVLLTQAADQPCGAGIPEVMAGQPAPQHDVLTPEVQPAQAIWVDGIRNSLDSDRKNYPTPNFDPYFKKLNVVDEAVDCGDRRVVKVEMSSFFKMPANRAYSINEDTAGELSSFAQMVTSIRE